MKKNLVLNLENEILKGSTLDICNNNKGVIYNILKSCNDNIELEYVSDKYDRKNKKQDFYDNCMLFFTLNSIMFTLSKKKLIYDIYRYLNEDGYIHIWDIDKKYGKTVDCNIKIQLPFNKIREVKIKDMNIFKSSSKDRLCKMLEKYFCIEYIKENDEIYYIKAKKKI